MKMYLGGTPLKSMNIRHYEVSTNDATLKSSDLQAGITAYAKGVKVTGTGKCFEFATYGNTTTNIPEFIPTLINVVEITSTVYPIKSLIGFDKMLDTDFTTEKVIGTAIVDGGEYPITIRIQGNVLTFSCEKTIKLEFFYGRDNYA